MSIPPIRGDNTAGEDTAGIVPTTASDRVRSVAVGITAAAMVFIPTLGAVIAGTEETAEEFDTEITPPDYAFAIWAPIFTITAGNAIQHAVNPTAAVNRRTGWWLAASYGANAAWSITAQSGRFRYTPLILPVAAGSAAVAHRRAQSGALRGAVRLVAHSSGLLFGWIGVASVVNLFATQRTGALSASTRTGRIAARVAAAGAAAGISAIIGTSRRGHTSIALASGWALATSAANREGTPLTRVISAAATILIAGTTLTRIVASRR